MRLVIQRVYDCSCIIDDEVYSEIKNGILCYVGISDDDDIQVAKKAVDKLIKMRIFEDENQKMNLSIQDMDYQLMLISQFTLFGECAKGNRPSFINAGNPDHANKIYLEMVEYAKTQTAAQGGVFAADMKINYTNDGPITLIFEL